MTNKQTVLTCLCFAAFGIVAASRNSVADEYVWARSNWGSGPNRPISAMNNGYGGYYVPKNAYGNNYEGQRFTNPNGFIIPRQTTQPAPRMQRPHWFRRW